MEKCSNPENICIDGSSTSRGKNHKYEAKNYLESQKFALSGLRLIFKNERNFRTQLIFAVLVIVAGIMLNIEHRDWISLFLLTTLVLVAEAFNSVIEAVCDTISQEFKVNIRYAKDVSAGAVLITAMVSAVSGLIILGPYILEFLQNVADTLL